MKRFFILLSILMFGCHHAAPVNTPPANLIATPERVRTVQTAITTTAKPHVFQLTKAIELMTPENLAVTKPQAQQDVKDLSDDIDLIEKDVAAITVSVAADTKKTQQLEKQIATLTDPERATIRHWGELGILIGTLIVGVYFAAGFIPYVGPFIQKGGKAVLFTGCFLVGLGFVLITLARFLATVELVIGGALACALIAAIAWLAYYVWSHHGSITGLTNLAGGKAVVLAAASPNLASPLNGPANGGAKP